MFVTRVKSNHELTLCKIRVKNVDTIILLDSNEKVADLPSSFFYNSLRIKRYSYRTIDEYSKIIRHYLKYLIDNEFTTSYSVDDYIKGTRALHVEDYLSYLQINGIGRATIHQRDACLKTFFDWLTTGEAGNVFSQTDNPYASGKLKTRSPHNIHIKYLNHIEFIQFIKYAFNSEIDRCIAHVMYETGLRISEISRVRFQDISGLLEAYPEADYFPLLVHGSKGRAGNIKERLTLISRPVLSRLWKMINNYPQYSEYTKKNCAQLQMLFIQNNSRLFNPGSFSQKIYRASKKGFESGVITRKVTSHMFRHSTAMSILCSEFGQDSLDRLQLVMVVLGHNQIETSQRYGSVSAPVLAELVRIRSRLEIVKRCDEAALIYKETELPYEKY